MSSAQSDETPTPDYTASIEFLERWDRRGPWVVVAINPNTKEIKAATFGHSTLAELRTWLEEWGTRKKFNCYFTVNPCMREMKKKPERVDILSLSWLHVDLDPRAGEDHAAERARIFEKLRNLPSDIPPPTCVIDSGNGGQAFWRLREPQLLDGNLETAIEADRWNKQLELRLGGDSCHNLDRVMRLPGTVNWPNAKKRAKGRVPVLASLVEFNDSQHDLSGFEKAPALAGPSSSPSGESSTAHRVAIDAANVKRFDSVDDIPELQSEDDPRNAKCRVCVVLGHDPDDPQKSRSEPLLFVCCQMVRAGCSDETIYSAITNPEFGISASVLDKGSSAERYAVRQIERARAQTAKAAGDFQGDGKGNLYKNLHNARLAIAKLGVSVEFDEFADRAMIAGLPEFGPYLDDAAVTRLRLEIDDRFKIVFVKEWFREFVSDLARRNKRHPVREFLDDLVWDGTARLDRWLSVYLGAAETEYTRAVGTLVLVAAVRRIRAPGCKFDEMLVLEGPQGGLKSTALAVLAVRGDWFSDDLPLNAKAQQFIEATVGKWIVEAGELKGMRKGDVESLKSCLSRSVDRSRMAYGTIPLERARQFVIVGTTNSERYLKDSTGNRRFWPVRVGEVQIAELRRDREQLWAEAAAREKTGASIRLDPSLYGAAAEEQEGRRVEDPFVGTLGAILNGVEGKLRAIDAWTIVGVPPGQQTQDHNARLGDAMRELGWVRTKLRFGGGPEWAYVSGDASNKLELALGEFGRVLGVRLAGTAATEEAQTEAVYGRFQGERPTEGEER